MFLARKTASLATNYPFRTLIISLLPSLIALIVILSTSSFNTVAPTLSAYFPRNAPQTRLHHAYVSAKRTYTLPRSAGLTLSVELPRSKLSYHKSLVLVLGPFNITQSTIRRVAFLEDIVVRGDWNSICFLDSHAPSCRGQCAQVLSVLNSLELYGIENDKGEFCTRRDDVSLEGVEAFKHSLDTGAFADEHKLIAKRGELVMLRSIFRVGEPFEGFNTTDTGQTEFYNTWVDRVATEVSTASTEEVPSILYGGQLVQIRIGQQVSRDLVFAAPAICLVFAIVWLHTGSFFLASVAMLQIFLSFPLAYVIYTYVLRQMYFSALQIFAIFLLLGIGADDVFVFTDAWKQVPAEMKDKELRERMEWTYNRAVKAMFTTTITTAVAFAVTAASVVMPMSTFGIWAAVLILVQFVMVITVYPSALIIWQRHLRGKKFCYCIRGPEDVKGDERTTCIPDAWRVIPTEDGQKRLLERFFHGPWVRVLQFLRAPLVFLGVAFLATSIYFATRLEPPRDDPQFLPNGHPLTVAVETLKNDFSTSSGGLLHVSMMWGIRDINRDGTSKFEPDNIGNVVMDGSFDLKQETTQRHIADVCARIRNDRKFAESRGVDCWIEGFIRWRKLKGRSEFETYENDASLMFDVLDFAKFRNTDNKMPFLRYLVEQMIMLSTDLRRVVSCKIRIRSPYRINVPYQEMGQVYEDWQYKLAELNALGPQSGNKAIVTADQVWVSQVTQQTLVSTMVRNIWIMIFVTTITLSVTTLNLGVSCIATISLTGIISSLLAIIYLIGWPLGVTESIIITMAMGYSFDGIAHIAMAYTQSDESDRFSRTRDALSTLGISIIFGALSTLFSAAMLLPASLVVFSQLAKLVIITIALTVIWSLVFLPACLLLIGPQHTFLSIKPLFRYFRRSKDVDESVDW